MLKRLEVSVSGYSSAEGSHSFWMCNSLLSTKADNRRESHNHFCQVVTHLQTRWQACEKAQGQQLFSETVFAPCLQQLQDTVDNCHVPARWQLGRYLALNSPAMSLPTLCKVHQHCWLHFNASALFRHLDREHGWDTVLSIQEHGFNTQPALLNIKFRSLIILGQLHSLKWHACIRVQCSWDDSGQQT